MSQVNKVKIAVVLWDSSNDIYMSIIDLCNYSFNQSTRNDYLLSFKNWGLKENVRLGKEEK